jgi:hypothetical protein
MKGWLFTDLYKEFKVLRFAEGSRKAAKLAAQLSLLEEVSFYNYISSFVSISNFKVGLQVVMVSLESSGIVLFIFLLPFFVLKYFFLSILTF